MAMAERVARDRSASDSTVAVLMSLGRAVSTGEVARVLRESGEQVTDTTVLMRLRRLESAGVVRRAEVPSAHRRKMVVGWEVVG